MQKYKNFICLLFITALVSMGISPACEFISGKNFIEICAADGSTRTIEVSGDFVPLDNETPEPTEKHADKSCDFCFTQTHQGKFTLSSGFVNSLNAQSDVQPSYKAIAKKLQINPLSQPRAPPFVIS